MTQQHRNPDRQDRTSSAPYNFVPLPERVVAAQELPDQDVYHADRQTGYFDIELHTLTPLYVRCGLSTRERPRTGDKRTAWQIAMAEKSGEKKAADFRDEMKNTPDFFFTNRRETPVIPGSSLRGMIRGLLEIVTYGKLTAVTDKQLFFRSVEPTSLGDHYRERMVGKAEGNSKPVRGNKVEAGFLRQDSHGQYAIHACTALRINRDRLNAHNPGVLYEGNGPNMTPRWNLQYKPIWIKQSGIYVDDISWQQASGFVEARLVITGNIPESRTKPGKQKEFVFLLPDASAEAIPVSEEMLEQFHDDDQITQWQQKAFPAEKPQKSCRKRDGHLTGQPFGESDPVFFLRENGNLTFFGRAQMFRLPYFKSPLDLVPDYLKSNLVTDFAEALFGYIREKNKSSAAKQGSNERAYAGRIFVTDGVSVPGNGSPWLHDPVIEPRILSTPKPTSFQHYLAQPDSEKRRLQHYGSADATLRGHKLYWHQGEITRDHIQEQDRPDERTNWIVNGRVKPDSTQHTRIKPVRDRVRFRFRVYFENLTAEELGALAWTLQPQGDGGDYAHKIGMGKSLGMGSVRLNQITTCLTDRRQRYETLFAADDWQRGESDATVDLESYRRAFETFLLRQLGLEGVADSICRIKRIAMLLRMMTWEAQPSNSDIFQSRTLNDRSSPETDFRNRQVLPYPLDNNDLKHLLDVKPLPGHNVPPSDAGPKRSPERSAQTAAPDPEPTVTLEDLRAGFQEPVSKNLPKRTRATVTDYRKAKVYVTLEGVDGFSGEIVCPNAPVYITPEKGDRYLVEVTYDKKDRVASVKFVKAA